MKKKSIAIALALSAGIFLSGAAASTLAQSFPSRPIRLVVAYPPGGATDILARAIAPKAGELLGQQIIIDNRTGANGNIGIGTTYPHLPNLPIRVEWEEYLFLAQTSDCN